MPSPYRLDSACTFCGRRFKRKGLFGHERACRGGASDRFRIYAVSGYRIDPRSQKSVFGGSARYLPTAYTICDSHRMWEDVKMFAPRSNWSSERARAEAERVCRHMNAAELEAELAEVAA